MRLAFAGAGAFLASLLLLGCGASDTSPLLESQGTTGTDAPSVDAILSFDGPSSLELAPGETREITITTSPPEAYEIYVALLDAPSDTSLDASHLIADKDGRILTSSTRKVRISTGGPQGEVPVQTQP